MATAVATKSFVASFAILWLLAHAEAFVPNGAGPVKLAARISSVPSGISPSPSASLAGMVSMSSPPTLLRMGLFDSVLSRFRSDELNGNDDGEGDFVRMEEMSKQFLGPGPVVILYQVPDGIDDDEVRDMLADGAPRATSQGISMARIASMTESPSSLIDLSLQEALETVIQSPQEASKTGFSRPLAVSPSSPPPDTEGSPVVIFSGFSRPEIMDSYNILRDELYQETISCYGKGQFLACAMAVPNAMNKPLRQVLSEISGDHAEAMKPASQNKIQEPEES